jgi:bacteriocin biosynthesis cyclodehydratase domain-containing protein
VTQTVPSAVVSPAWTKVAATRPRIRRDVLCTDTGKGAVFHNSDGGFALTGRAAYRFATLLMPRLDGTATVASLCQGLPEGQRLMVANLVSTLYDRGFARDVEPGTDGPGALSPQVASRFAAQLAYVDHYAGDAARRFGRFRSARVAVLGDDEVSRWAALSLVRNGSGSVAVGFSDPALAAEADAHEAAGAPVLVSTVDASASYDVVLVGPSAGPAEMLSLLRAGLPAGETVIPAWTVGDRVVIGPSTVAGTPGCWACAALRLGGATDMWRELALGLPTPGTPLAGPLAAMVGNLLGYEVFRLRTGALPAETSRRVLVQDIASLDVTAQPLLPDPRCPFCAEPPSFESAVDIAGWSPTVVDPADTDGVLAALRARSVLVQPDAGPFRRYADEAITQLPLKVGVVEVGDRAITAFDVQHVAGARLRALESAASVHANTVVPLTGVVSGGPDLLDPARLGIASGAGGPVPAWVPARSLLSGSSRLVPAAAARPFGRENAAGLVTRTSAGLGAADSAAGAVVAGLLSALSFAALTAALRRRGPVSRVDLAGSDAELTFLVRSADTLGVGLELLQLDAPVPVLLARTGGDSPVWAVGVALGWRTAAVAAARDLLGQVQLEAADLGDPLLADLDPAALVVTGETAARPAGTVTTGELLERLRAAGTDALVLPAAAPDLATAGLHVARVVLETSDER